MFDQKMQGFNDRDAGARKRVDTVKAKAASNVTRSNDHISKAQYDAHWMAYTGNREFKKDPRIIVEANGHYYVDAKGRKIFDGLSGLWTCGLGHGRPEITEAVSKQIARLDYSPAFQFGHPSAFQLAEKIVSYPALG